VRLCEKCEFKYNADATLRTDSLLSLFEVDEADLETLKRSRETSEAGF
jgi:hypothetical protein